MLKSFSAMILAAGYGKRMLSLTKDIPKPLISIKGKPILHYIIDYLKKQGEYKIIVAVGHKSEKICEYIKNNYANETIRIVDSGNVDIIKRIQDICEKITGDFLVLYGDTISNVEINKLISYHNSHQQPITMTVWPLSTQFGLVDIDKDGKVKSFQEKPTLDKWINIGYIYINYEMINVIKEYQSFEKFLHEMAVKGFLNTFKHLGVHITVNTLNELEQAEINIVKLLKR